MNNAQQKFLSAAGAALLMILSVSSAPVRADDSEVFTNSAFLDVNSVRPNILFVIDTSGSMGTEVNTYDPNISYAGPCANDRIYWRTENNRQPPDCTTTQWINASQNRCAAAYNGMMINGWWRGRTAMVNPGNSFRWENIRANATGADDMVECEADAGVHGSETGNSPSVSANRWARTGTGTATNRWTNTPTSTRLGWGGRQTISYYSGNYANWWYGGDPGRRQTRLQVVRDVAKSVIDNLDGVNLGLMRYSNNGGSGDAAAEGGMVTFPVTQLTPTVRTAMKAALDGYTSAGWTPLSETYYEAHQYMSGGKIEYGDDSFVTPSVPLLSVASSRIGNSMASDDYKSPMEYSCQNNFIVYLTDGLPTQDNSADSEIESLTGESCPALGPNQLDVSQATSGRCMVQLARYMHDNDLRPTVLGKQNVTTYVVGFGDDIAASSDFLNEVATAGGGRAFTQSDAAGLTTALEEIFNEIKNTAGTTFVSPAVAVNAFNRTQTLNEIYVSVFAPSRGLHWPGNIKKYALAGGQIVGQGGTPAVDPATGYFREDAKSLWTPAADPPDGRTAAAGGAASRIPAWQEGVTGSRNVYTYLGANSSLSAPANHFAKANSALTASMLGVGDAAERDAVIEHARGRDSQDADGDGDIDERSRRMGDPMHARPSFVIYGGTATAPIGVVYATTNDGFLHAIDSTTGEELWSFIPPEFLSRQVRLMDNPVTPDRDYSLDGDVKILKFDVNQDGMISGNDRVVAYFGFARGGATYYALDITDRNDPRFMWKHTDATLPRLGAAWSTPQITRVNVAGATQNPQKMVLIFGAGYDPAQDNYDYTVDTVGTGIYMVDAVTGAPLWSAAKTGGNFNNASMVNAFASRIAVVDFNGDEYADRLYASDLGGQVWRFDVFNGNSANQLVTGGVMARLGGAGESSPSRAVARRFYNIPDVALIESRGSAPYFNIAIGSGYRGHPLETDTQDRFYSLRDYRPFQKLPQTVYNGGTWTVATDSTLVDVTNSLNMVLPVGAPGWKLEMRRFGWVGEKVLSESITASGVILFTTFTPLAPDNAQPCLARTKNRVYAVQAINGSPAFDINGDGSITTDDYSADLRQDGVPPSVTVLINNLNPPNNGDGILPPKDGDGGDRPDGNEQEGGPGDPGGGGNPPGGNPPPGGGPATNCTIGVEAFGRCPTIGQAVRTFWLRRQ